jgi:hypothetical protein
MTRKPNPSDHLYTQVDVTSGVPGQQVSGSLGDEHLILLRQMLTAMERQNELMEELVAAHHATQRQRQAELNNWKKAHPDLSQYCRQAAETLSKVQAVYLDRITADVADNSDSLLDGEFMLTEFVDKFGPRLAHLNGMVQVLSQLGSPMPTPENPPRS